MQDDAKSESIAERKGRCRDEKVGKQGRRNALAMNIVNHLIKHTPLALIAHTRVPATLPQWYCVFPYKESMLTSVNLNVKFMIRILTVAL